jgi:hypothetical protein
LQNFGKSEPWFSRLTGLIRGLDVGQEPNYKKPDEWVILWLSFLAFKLYMAYVSVFDMLALSQFRLFPFKAYKLLEA